MVGCFEVSISCSRCQKRKPVGGYIYIATLTAKGFIGLEMAHFYKYNDFRDVKISAQPIGFRRFWLFRNFPYWIGTKPKFRIKTITGKENYNNTLPVYEWFSNEQAPRQVRSLGPFEKKGEKKYLPIEGFYIPTDGALEYWINKPHDSGAWKIADFRGNWKDQTWIVVLSAIGGFVVGFFGDFILKLLGIK